MSEPNQDNVITVPRLLCQCGCNTSAMQFRMTYIRRSFEKGEIERPGTKGWTVRKDHADVFMCELNRRGVLGGFVEANVAPFRGRRFGALRNAIHRIGCVRMFRILVRDANFRRDQKELKRTVREATIMWLLPAKAANAVAVVFGMSDARRKKKAIAIAAPDVKNESHGCDPS